MRIHIPANDHVLLAALTVVRLQSFFKDPAYNDFCQDDKNGRAIEKLEDEQQSLMKLVTDYQVK